MTEDIEPADRTRGVDFGPLSDELAALSYPVSTDELLSTVGECELNLERAQMTLRDALEPHGEQTYDSPDDVVRAVLTMVDESAVGRVGYSDRGGRSPGVADSDPPL